MSAEDMMRALFKAQEDTAASLTKLMELMAFTHSTLRPNAAICKDPGLPTYAGNESEDLSQWFAAIETHAEALRMSADDLVPWIEVALKGNASMAMLRLKQGNAHPTWRELQDFLRKAFQPVARNRSLRRLLFRLELVNCASMREYVEKFLDLRRQLDTIDSRIAEEDLILYFQKGLPADLVAKMDMESGLDDITAVVNYAVRACNAVYNFNSVTPLNAAFRTNNVLPLHANNQYAGRSFNRKIKFRHNKNRNSSKSADHRHYRPRTRHVRKKPSGRPAAANATVGPCFKCGQNGHLAADAIK